MINETIGKGWIKKPAQLENLMEHVDDPILQNRFLAVKKERKQILADYIKEHNGIEVDVDSIFDVQVKRLHAYKRQLLNILHVIYLYQEMKYIIEGFRLVEEGFKAGADIECLIIEEGNEQKANEFLKDYLTASKVYLMKKSLFSQLIATENTQGVLAVVNMNNSTEEIKGDFYLLCDKVQDPGNLGTIIRTAHAAGASGIILTKGTVDIYNDKTIRSTMGSVFYLPIIYDNDLSFLKKLKEDGFSLVTTSLQESKNFFEEDLKEKGLAVEEVTEDVE